MEVFNFSSKKNSRTPKEGGQAVLEYILLVALAVFISLALLNTIREGVDRGMMRFGGSLEGQLKTGRVDVRTFRN